MSHSPARFYLWLKYRNRWLETLQTIIWISFHFSTRILKYIILSFLFICLCAPHFWFDAFSIVEKLILLTIYRIYDLIKIFYFIQIFLLNDFKKLIFFTSMLWKVNVNNDFYSRKTFSMSFKEGFHWLLFLYLKYFLLLTFYVESDKENLLWYEGFKSKNFQNWVTHQFL
jgi:hypothetical protein